jgi:Asp-tRNA(Asn)/Glu-tRNA(Gln) amidotransferase A subunit family amidase
MVPVALGTQTLGSVLRPASFCGVTGFKPSYGLVPMEGVLPVAKTLDTLGFFTHTAADMAAFWNAMGYSTTAGDDGFLAAPDPLPELDPAMAEAFQNTLSRLRRNGLTIRSVDIAGLLASLNTAARTVMFYEGARFHEARYREFGDRMADMADLVRAGLKMSVQEYDDAKRTIANGKRKMAEIYEDTPVILVPAATGPAPAGLAYTGDPRMNSPWTALGTPAISIPMPITGALPLGLQLTAAPGDDARVIRTAMRLERLLASGQIKM